MKVTIENPELNPIDQGLRRWTYELGNRTKKRFVEHLKEDGVTPLTHPKAIDLCAGDGSMAQILIENGWSPKNITCVDQFVTKTPLADGAKWKYINLGALASSLKIEEDLEPEIVQMKGNYDIVTLVQGHMGRVEEQAIVKFFTKPNGFSFHLG